MSKRGINKQSSKLRYQYGIKLQKEGAKELFVLGLQEIIGKFFHMVIKLGNYAIAIGKIIAGTILKVTSNNVPRRVKYRKRYYKRKRT